MLIKRMLLGFERCREIYSSLKNYGRNDLTRHHQFNTEETVNIIQYETKES